MADRKSNITNAFQTTLGADMSAVASSANLVSVAGLNDPFYLVIEPDNASKREYVFCSVLVGNIATISERYLEGSAAASGLIHPAGSVVRMVVGHQTIKDLHDRIDGVDSELAGLGNHGNLAGLNDDDHPIYIKEKSSGGLAIEVPEHNHESVNEGGVLHSGYATDGEVATAVSSLSALLTPRVDQAEIDIAALEAVDVTLDARVDALEAPIAAPGYLFQQRIIYTVSGTFTKASFPGLRAIRVVCQGGQGQGGGCAATAAGENSVGGGGGAGSWAESFITAANLDAVEAVTVGPGGSGAGAGAPGNNGGDSIFDTIPSEVRGVGGVGGGLGAATTAINTSGAGGAGANTGTGDRVIPGGFGSDGVVLATNRCIVGEGGLQREPTERIITAVQISTSGTTQTSQGRGSNNNASQAARAGGAGMNGIVIVDVYV